MQRFPQRCRRLVVLPEARARRRARLARDDDRQHAERHDVDGAGRGRPRARRVGGEPRLPRLPRVAEPAPTIPSTPTSCASTSTRNPASTFDEVRAAAREVHDAARRARHRGVAEDHRQPRHPRVRAARAARGSPIEVRARRGRRGPRARAPPSRRDHRRVVEGRARRAGLRRLQPERAAQDGVRRVVGAGPARARRCRRRSPGTSSTTSTPTRSRSAPCRQRVAERGDPWADDRRRPQSLAAAARDVRSATWRRACRTRRGRPSTRRCRASRRGSRPAGPRSRPPRRSRRPPRRRRRRRSARGPRPGSSSAGSPRRPRAVRPNGLASETTVAMPRTTTWAMAGSSNRPESCPCRAVVGGGCDDQEIGDDHRDHRHLLDHHPPVASQAPLGPEAEHHPGGGGDDPERHRQPHRGLDRPVQGTRQPVVGGAAGGHEQEGDEHGDAEPADRRQHVGDEDDETGATGEVEAHAAIVRRRPPAVVRPPTHLGRTAPDVGRGGLDVRHPFVFTNRS